MDDTCFLLIRHAESTWNAAGRWQGHADPPLSARGRAQADELAGRLAGESLDALLASDLGRAQETARSLATKLGLQIETDPRWRELDVGSWSGLTRDEIDASAPDVLDAFEREDPDARPGGGETRREIRARVRAHAADVARARAGSRIAVVTHLGVIRALLPGADPEHASCTRVTFAEIRDAIARSDTP